MLRFRILFRFLTLLLAFSTVPALLGGLLFGVRGVVFALLLAIFSILWATIRVERRLLDFYKDEIRTPKGLGRSIELTLGSDPFGRKNRRPKIVVFGDPYPNFHMVRALGGSGTILLSQGLLAILNDRELRAYIESAVKLTSSNGVVFQSFCSSLIVWTLSLAPKRWSDLFFSGNIFELTEDRSLSSFSAIRFVILFPIVRFLIQIANRPMGTPKPVSQSLVCSIAVQKVEQSRLILGSSNRSIRFSIS